MANLLTKEIVLPSTPIPENPETEEPYELTIKEWNEKIEEICAEHGVEPKRLTIQEWDGEVEDILTDRQKLKSGTAINDALHGIVKDSDNFDFNKMLVGDRVFIMVQSKILSHGQDGSCEYEFQARCKFCPETNHYVVDLADLEVRHLTSEDTVFEAVLPRDGSKVKYKLMTGKDESKLKKIKKNNSDSMMTSYMMLRVTEIEDTGQGKRPQRGFLKSLGSYDRTYLRQEMDKNDCGVDTTIKVECPDCLADFETELPMDENFYLPSRVM